MCWGSFHFPYVSLFLAVFRKMFPFFPGGTRGDLAPRLGPTAAEEEDSACFPFPSLFSFFVPGFEKLMPRE